MKTLWIFVVGIVAMFQFISAKPQSEKGENMLEKTIYQFRILDINKQPVDWEKYKGKVILVVNVASKCGFTKQYAGLQKLYEKYKGRGLVIMGFPCNDFGGQEPGTNDEIKQFCAVNFGVTFPMMDKIKVLGPDKAPLYEWLTNNPTTGKGDIGWNFEKFLIGKDGKVIKRFKSAVAPESKEVIDAIEQAL
ncbi:MAG: glutathione peroxidase [Calditrichia bacterium]